MNELFTLVFLHFLGDFPLQGKYLSDKKCELPIVMIIHCFIYGGLFFLFADLSIYLTGIIMASHYAIDYAMACKFIKMRPDYKLALDQYLHVLLLVIIWFFSQGV